MAQTNTESIGAVRRARHWYTALFVILALFGVRLFYLQVIRYGHFKQAASVSQLKQYEIPAERGSILAYEGGAAVPMVLNQKLFTLYADPTYIKDADKVAAKIIPIIGAGDYKPALTAKETRYSVLKKKLTPEQQKQIAALKEPGLGTVEQDYRTYPQGSIAAQLLGFVNDEGSGVYGVEQALNAQLKGKPGELKAVTDSRGVPLAASKNNTDTAAVNGKDVVLTVDIAMQQQLETILAQGLKNAKSDSGSALIMDIKTGTVKAMANYPSYDPAQYDKVEDGALFGNAAVSSPLEVGSIMKPLTTAAAIDQGVVRADQTYADPGSFIIDDSKVTNVETSSAQAATRSIGDILNLSLNTGATWMLMQMGGGKLNEKARDAWYDYAVNHFMFGKTTGIEQGNGAEATGYMPKPADNGAGINLTYANTAFGQAMTATPIQMGAAYCAILNGGTYYKPSLIAGTLNDNGQLEAQAPVVVKKDIIKPSVSKDVIGLMEYSVAKHTFTPKFDLVRYSVGGKTGTAQLAQPGGGYYNDRFNGSYAGFVGGDTPQYIIIVTANTPKVAGYAGTTAAQPIFSGLAHMLINNFNVTPRS